MYTNNLDQYFKSVANHSLLTREQEVELAKKIEKGDIEAKKLMIKSNLRLAISIAKKYSKYGQDIEDLIQESNIGLMKAVDKFDWRKGFKFSTYACWWIKQAITRYITTNNSILNVPSHTIANARKVFQIMKEYEEEFGVNPTNEEISEILGINEKHVKQAISSIKTKYIASIDTPISDENGKTLADIIPSGETSIDTILDNQIIKKEIIKSLKLLSKREELVLRLRFGIDEIEPNDSHIYEIKQ